MLDFFILIFSCFILYNYITSKAKKRKFKTPPGPKTYPIVGCTWELAKLKTGGDLLELLKDYTVSNNYVFYSPGFYLGGICGVARPEHIQAVLTSKAGLHKSRLLYSRIKLITGSMMAKRVEQWQPRRKLFAPAFHQGSLKKYFVKFADRTHDRFAPILAEHYADKDYFFVEDVISLHILRGVSESMFGVDTTEMGPGPVMKAIHAVEGISDRFTENMKKHFLFPEPETEDDRNLHGYSALLVDKYEEQTAKYRGKPGYEDKFCVGMENLRTLPKEEQIIELRSAIVGAFDTVSVTLSYFCVMLAMHPHIQDKVYEELQSIFGDSDRQPTEEDLKDMVYLEACMKESMRLHASGPFVVRRTTDDLKLDDEYTIPAGTIVFILIFLLHRNPSIWKNPLVFDPEHFSKENVKKLGTYDYIPFSAGPRVCLGYKFAFMMMKLTMSAMIRKYHLETDMKMSDLKFDRLFTLKASHLRIRLKTRTK